LKGVLAKIEPPPAVTAKPLPTSKPGRRLRAARAAPSVGSDAPRVKSEPCAAARADRENPL